MREKFEEIQIVFVDSLQNFVKELENSGEKSAAQKLRAWIEWHSVTYFHEKDKDSILKTLNELL